MSQIKTCLIALFILTFLLNSIIRLPVLSQTMAIFAGLVCCLSIRDLKTSTRNMVGLLLIGSGSLIWSGPGNFDWVQAMIENAGITTLLLTAPMMGTILYYAPYDNVISAVANRYIRTNYMFFIMTMALVTLLCPVMNVAAVAFAYQLLTPLAAKYSSAVLHRALTRGFSANVFWAPNLGSMAVVLQYVPITWQELVPVGIVFTVVVFIIACLAEKFNVQPIEPHQNGQSASTEGLQPIPMSADSRNYIKLLVIQVLLNLAVLTMLTRYAGQNIYVAVAVVALIMPLLSAFPLRKVGIYRQRLTYYLNNTLSGMSNEFVLFLSIGFFGYALAQSPIIAVIQMQLAKISDFSTHVLVLIILIAIGGLSMTGIHPMITISALAIALGNIEIGLSNMQLAITLLAGYILYLCMSPFSSMLMIMTGLSGQNAYSMGLKMNARFVLVVSLMVAFLVHFWQQI